MPGTFTKIYETDCMQCGSDKSDAFGIFEVGTGNLLQVIAQDCDACGWSNDQED